MFQSTVETGLPPTWLQKTADWVKRHERPLLLLGVGVQLSVLVGMILLRAIPLVTGETVLLRVIPVDPRDMFRGDYVILRYDFSRRGPGDLRFGPGASASHGETLFIWLAPEGDGLHWRCDRVASESPPAGQKYIRAKAGPHGTIEAGIESFYVQEGTGHQYEEAIGRRQLSAEISLTADGQATLRRLRIQ